MNTIYLAGGCFWGLEAYFKQIPGIINTEVGYTGGDTVSPTYEQVCTGTTGHAETVQIEFNPNIISLSEILRHFERIHEPTSLNRQGNDIGSQYRSAIFYLDPDQQIYAEHWKGQAQTLYTDPIVTQILPLDHFYPAEAYHQDYLDKHPGGYCHIDLDLAKTPL